MKRKKKTLHRLANNWILTYRKIYNELFLFYRENLFIFETQWEKNIRKNSRESSATTRDKSGSEAVFTGRIQADRIAHAAAINRVEFVSRPRRRSKSPYASRWTGDASIARERERERLLFSLSVRLSSLSAGRRVDSSTRTLSMDHTRDDLALGECASYRIRGLCHLS